MEANRAGADEALMLNQMGRLAEGTAYNVFIVRRGVLSTTPTSDGAPEGMARNHIIELAGGNLALPCAGRR